MSRNILLYFLALIFVSGCGSSSQLFKETRIAMDTFAEISCYDFDKDIALKAINDAFREIERIERLFSKFDEKSEVSRINRLAGKEEVKVDREVFKVINDAVHFSAISEGSFDITVAPLMDIWKDARKNNLLPDIEAIQNALKHVGYKNIVLNEKESSMHFLDADTKIDLGGIAKGYAVDRAKEILFSYGIENALINIGGNIYAMGNPPAKKAWQIGIQNPRDKNAIIQKVSLKNQAVSTSGDYERFFDLNGKRFSHILNPVTGWPAQGIMGVTVISITAEQADALSTAVFVMGKDKGLKLIESLKDSKAFIF